MDSLEEIRRQRALAYRAQACGGTDAPRRRSRSPRGAEQDDVDMEPEALRILSWNIDGLDNESSEEDMLGRTLWVLKEISERRPHVVFLQELVDFNFQIVQERLGSAYHVVPQRDPAQPYFVAILVHRYSMEIQSSRTVSFPHSKMGRSAVYVCAKLRTKPEIRIGLMTAHLESQREYSAERKSQLSICSNLVSDEDVFVLGGDLNLRDNEVPAQLANQDCWILAGRDKQHEFTWDTSRNDNVVMPGRAKPKCRFDRLYLKGNARVADFSLTGTERIPGLRRFASDHFGVFAKLMIG